MTTTNETPRPGPASEDGSGIRRDVVNRGVRCPNCQGRGELRTWDNHAVRCGLCQGTGWISDILAGQLVRQGN